MSGLSPESCETKTAMMLAIIMITDSVTVMQKMRKGVGHKQFFIIINDDADNDAGHDAPKHVHGGEKDFDGA